MAQRRIAYLCSEVTITGSPNRRVDAFEHDLMLAALRPAFAERSMDVVEVRWDDADFDWSSVDAAIIGTTWDYGNRAQEFLNTLEIISSQTTLFNSVATVRWNFDKRYLRELEAQRAAMIPTVWIDEPDGEAIKAAFETLGCDDLVVKQQIGASSRGQHRLALGDPLPKMNQPMMAQAFQPSILIEGEYSFIFIDGEFSHAVLKQAAAGDYRIQSEYGGTESVHSPTRADLETAAGVLALVEESPLYARVDMIRGETGSLLLMELELIEPYLYVEQGLELGAMLAAAVVRRLETR